MSLSSQAARVFESQYQYQIADSDLLRTSDEMKFKINQNKQFEFNGSVVKLSFDSDFQISTKANISIDHDDVISPAKLGFPREALCLKNTWY